MILAAALSILAFAVAFHLHWAAGGKVGITVSLPQHPDGTPVMAHRLGLWPPAAALVAFCLLLIALLLLCRTGYLALPLQAGVVHGVLLLCGTAFIARALVPNRYVGFFKTLRTTRWARYDSRVYSPLFFLLGVLIIRLTV